MPRAPERPELEALVQKAKAAWEAMTPEQRCEHRAAQRRSWVRGELMLDYPELTRDEADALIDKVI